jgi:hypothetical protein
MRALTAAIAAAGITAVLVGGVAIATSPSETITACVTERTGAMRYISDGECRPNEMKIDWNRQGPPGADGAQGPAGTNGLEPIGRFTPMQLVAGAVVTCTSTSVTQDLERAICEGMKLNGLDVHFDSATEGAPSVTKICSVVTGAGVGPAPNPDLTSEYFRWDGAKWVLGTSSVIRADNLTCFR